MPSHNLQFAARATAGSHAPPARPGFSPGVAMPRWRARCAWPAQQTPPRPPTAQQTPPCAQVGSLVFRHPPPQNVHTKMEAAPAPAHTPLKQHTRTWLHARPFTVCRAGYGGVPCSLCAAGSFSPGGNSSVARPACTACPPNTTTVARGATNRSNCSTPGGGAAAAAQCSQRPYRGLWPPCHVTPSTW